MGSTGLLHVRDESWGLIAPHICSARVRANVNPVLSLFLQTASLALQRLFEHVQLLIELRQLLPFRTDFSDRVEHRRVVSPTKQLTDFRKTFLRQLLGQVHRDLPRPHDGSGALLAVHVRDLDLVEVGHRLLNVFHADLPVLDRQQVAQCFAR